MHQLDSVVCQVRFSVCCLPVWFVSVAAVVVAEVVVGVAVELLPYRGRMCLPLAPAMALDSFL